MYHPLQQLFCKISPTFATPRTQIHSSTDQIARSSFPGVSRNRDPLDPADPAIARVRLSPIHQFLIDAAKRDTEVTAIVPSANSKIIIQLSAPKTFSASPADGKGPLSTPTRDRFISIDPPAYDSTCSTFSPNRVRSSFLLDASSFPVFHDRQIRSPCSHSLSIGRCISQMNRWLRATIYGSAIYEDLFSPERNSDDGSFPETCVGCFQACARHREMI